MKYTTLGNTDIKVSRICLGTMTYGEQNTEDDAHEQLNFALDKGVNFIDTAELYSIPSRLETFQLTEKYIGSWIKKEKKRNEIVIATKISGPGTKHIRNGATKFNKKDISEAIEGSLHRLNTEYIDLYQLHWPERKTNYFGRLGYSYSKDDRWNDNFLEVLEIMQEHKKAGKIRSFGISNETPWGVSRFLHLAELNKLPKVVSVQNPYNLLNRAYEVGMAEISIREEVGLLAYSPMAFGLLSGKYYNGTRPEKARISLFENFAFRYNSPQTRQAANRYVELARDNGLSPAQMSLSFVNSRSFITSTIIGATTIEQLEENIDSINCILSEEILSEIDKIHRLIPNPAP